MFDLHIHTRNSHDSKMTPREIADMALSLGLCGIALTDHADFGYTATCEHLCEIVEGTLHDAKEVEALGGGELTVLCGVELGGAPYDLEGARRLLLNMQLDVVLGSIHFVKGNGFAMGSYRMDFSKMQEQEIYAFLETYFDRVLDLVSLVNINSLAHLTYPLRYINGKHGCHIDPMRCRDRIEEIFRVMIERGIALEINTSSVDNLIYDFVPSPDIVALYRSLGGRLITLGSDAHHPDQIGKGFARAREMLLSLGFTEYHYFQARCPVAVPLVEEDDA